ncbi:MAG: YihY/virulence factor BrkB family protein [Clostridia bacterium]|nr:YihY/virulence factor BrkB family protein [Clostridia bacterium]
MKSFFRRVRAILKIFLEASIDATVIRSSAAASFYALFSIFPLLIFLSALSNFFGSSEALITRMNQFLPPQIRDGIIAYFRYASSNNSTGFLILGAVFSVWFLYRLVDYLNYTLSVIYTPDFPAPFLKRLPRAVITTLIVLISIPILFLTIVFGKNILISLQGMFSFPTFLIWLWRFIRFPIVAFVMYGLLAVAYRFSTYHVFSARDVSPGAAISFVTWLTVTVLFAGYLDKVGDYGLLYGALGTVIALLIWLYMSSYSFLFGAVFNIKYKKYKDREVTES